LKHTIRIAGAGPGPYAVSGAVEIQASASPIQDAAKMLILEAGASSADTLHVVGSDFNLSPMSLGKLAAPRLKPLRSDIERAMRSLARFS
jgi:hypothetical protein